MTRLIVIGLGLAGTLSVSLNAGTQERERPTNGVAQVALQYFESVTDFDALLGQLRRPAPSASVRAWVMNNLPEDGQLTPTVKEAAKLQALLPVLAFHGREHDMELRLIAVGGLAFAGLHARTVLLISREALRILSTDELVAIAAHELGHDYIWHEYAKAERDDDTSRLQELELRCDGFAVITMASFRVDPERLVAAVIKLKEFNGRMFGKLNDPRYVPLDQRIWFIRAVAKLTGARDGR